MKKNLAASIFLSVGLMSSSTQAQAQKTADAQAKKEKVLAAATVGAAKTAATPAGAGAPVGGETGPNGEMPPGEAVPAVPAKSYYSAVLEQAVKQYRSAPSDATYGQMLGALRSVLLIPGAARISPAIMIKDNPVLSDWKPRVVDAGAVRLWTFPKAPERSHMLMQWFDTHQQVVGAGRRKKLIVSHSLRFQDFNLPAQINVKDAGILAYKEPAKEPGKDAAVFKTLVISGDNEDGSLWVSAYKFSEGGWQANPAFLTQIPSFLQSNVSGRLSFRGSDLIYNVGKMLLVTDSNGTKRWLPEAESANYRFWLKASEGGYVLAPSVPNEEAFAIVHQFMQALQHSKTDVARSLLVDPHLASIPKYLGLQGKSLDSAARVVEMSLPPSRGQRFRLINIGKDDLIFDVGKAKGLPQIKAIFVAQPDPFLQENSKNFPLYTRFDAPVVEVKKDAELAPAAPGTSGAAAAAVKKK